VVLVTFVGSEQISLFLCNKIVTVILIQDAQ